MKKSDHITALFVGGLYYLYKGDKQMASLMFSTAVEILERYPFTFIGSA